MPRNREWVNVIPYIGCAALLGYVVYRVFNP